MNQRTRISCLGSLAVIGTALMAASATTALAAPIDDTSAIANNNAAIEDGTYVDGDQDFQLRELVRTNPTEYGGAIFRADNTVDIYVAGTQAERAGRESKIADWAKSHRNPVNGDRERFRVVFKQAKRPFAELADARNVLHAISNMPEYRGDGFDVEASVLKVDVTEYTPTIAAFKKRLGDAVQISVDPTTTRGERTYRRWDPANPYHGGAYMGAVGVGGCTSSFAVIKSSVERVLTAGHCGPIGTKYKVWPGNDSSAAVGDMAVNLYFTPTHWLDTGQITKSGISYQARIFNGTAGIFGEASDGSNRDYTDSTALNVHSAQSGVVTQNVCFDGAVSGQNCDNELWDADDYCHQFTGESWQTCGLGRAASSTYHFIGGDSGGPVFRTRTSTSVYAVGTIVGQFYSSGRWLLTYHPVTRIMAAYGGMTLKSCGSNC